MVQQYDADQCRNWQEHHVGEIERRAREGGRAAISEIQLRRIHVRMRELGIDAEIREVS